VHEARRAECLTAAVLRPRRTARQRLAFRSITRISKRRRKGAERVAPAVGVLKVGLELFVREGPKAVELGRDLGARRLPRSEAPRHPRDGRARGARAAALGVRYLTVHASGGRRCWSARRSPRHAPSPLTLPRGHRAHLTRRGRSRGAGARGNACGARAAPRRARVEAGVRGFVTSPAEVARAASRAGPRGRPRDAWAFARGRTNPGDQKRIATPAQAIAAGADLLVVGRPIRDAADPLSAAMAVVSEIADA
jgi:orotidine-5'-phosphate decarboxylase